MGEMPDWCSLTIREVKEVVGATRDWRGQVCTSARCATDCVEFISQDLLDQTDDIVVISSKDTV